MRLTALIFTAACLCAQPAKPILEHTFENNQDNWLAMGNHASVRTVSGGAVAGSKSALAFQYKLEAKQMAAAVCPVQTSLAGMKSVRFWLKTDHATPVAVLLSEAKPGGDYTAVVWSPKAQWQEVELSVEDFSVNDGPTDPKDPNGKLDLDKVQGFGVVDLSFFALAINGAIPIKSNAAGEHTLWLDDVRMLETAVAGRTAAIDNFERRNIQWIAVGGATLSIAADGPLKARAMQASYMQAADGVVLLLRRIGHVNLGYSSGITVEMASERPAHVIVALEEKVPDMAQPVRFHTTVELPGGRTVVRRQLAFKEFDLAEDAPSNAPSRVDPAYLRTLSVVDLQGMLAGARGTNTIWMSPVAGYK